MPIQRGHEDAVPVPFRFTGLTNGALATDNDRIASDHSSTTGTRSISGIWELLQFWFEEEDMAPRTVNKPNWMLVLTASSMAITVLTLLCAGIWGASQKSTNLDVVSEKITSNTLEIHRLSGIVVELQLQVQGLQDKNTALLDKMQDQNTALLNKIADIRIEAQTQKK